MNRDCHGDYYYIGRERFYRCFMDGAVMKASIVGALCPRCHRSVEGINRGPVKTRRYSVTEVFIDDIGWVQHEQR